MEYKIGTKFEGNYPPEAACWCNENGCELNVSFDDKGIRWFEIVVSEQPVYVTIMLLKQELASSDYKVTKCYEASLTGLPMPYDVTILTSERQALRDEINRLENLQ